jgi:hypothetical protein
MSFLMPTVNIYKLTCTKYYQRFFLTEKTLNRVSHRNIGIFYIHRNFHHFLIFIRFFAENRDKGLRHLD